jgi:hypothetical protein
VRTGWGGGADILKIEEQDYDTLMNEFGRIEKKLNELKRDFQAGERQKDGQEVFEQMITRLPDQPAGTGDAPIAIKEADVQYGGS